MQLRGGRRGRVDDVLELFVEPEALLRFVALRFLLFGKQWSGCILVLLEKKLNTIVVEIDS